jgi:multidrug efflux system outer membrane protein
LLLASSVADTYLGWQADQSRLALARVRERLVQQEGAIAAARIHADLDPGDDLDRSGLALAAAREQIAALEGSAKLRVVELAALAGRAPSALPPLAPKALPAVGGNLPDDVTIDLIARRADLTASRWRVEAAEKNLESARAEFLPDISINALLGLQSIDVGTLLKYGSRVPQARARRRSTRPWRAIGKRWSRRRATWPCRHRPARSSRPNARNARSRSTPRCNCRRAQRRACGKESSTRETS